MQRLLSRSFFKQAARPEAPNDRPAQWNYGLTTVFEDDDPVVDIVFVHGLNGDSRETYRHEDSSGSECLWIESILPRKLREHKHRCRILSYGYNANTHEGPISVQSVWDGGQQFLSHVMDSRSVEMTEERPLIIFAYSLGGLVVKSALVTSHLSSPVNEPRLKALSLSTHAIFWFGVPHRGADGDLISLGRVVLNIVAAVRQRSDKMVEFMDPKNEALQGLFENFNRISHHFHQRSFWEDNKTMVRFKSVGVKCIQVVPRDSAVIPGQSNNQPTVIFKDHSNLVRYTGEEDPDFVTVSNALLIELKRSFKQINNNWADWKKELKKYQYGPSRVATNWPFPQDHRFKGRKGELDKLKSSLQGEENIQTTAITGAAGVGKTSLALQYAYSSENSHCFVVWINAKSKASVEDGFIWVLAQLVRLAAEDAPQGKPDFGKISRELQITGLLSEDGVLLIKEDDQGQRDRAVQAVMSWLTIQPDHSWLVVFDEHDTLDFRLRDFYAKCAWGNYMITSRRPDIIRYATDSLELGGLAPDDALEVLLNQSGRDGKDEEVREYSKKIIEMLDYHPLAIDSAASYLHRRPFVSLERYIAIVRNKMNDVRPKELLDGKDRLWPDYTLTCMTTFEISHDALMSESPNAAKLLQLCAWLNKDNIWVPYLREQAKIMEIGASEEEVDSNIGLLCSYSLVRAKVGKDMFGIHAVIHIWSRERLPSHSRMNTMLKAFSSLLHSPYRLQGGIIELLQPEAYSMQRSAISHLLYMLDVADEYFGIGSLRSVIFQKDMDCQNIQNEVLSVVSEALRELRDIEESTSFDLASCRPSPLCVRDEWAQKHPQEFQSLQKEALRILQTVPGILFEQNRRVSAMRWQLRLLFFELAFEDSYLEVLAEPDTFIWCISSSLLLLGIYFSRLGEVHTAKRLLLFIAKDFPSRCSIPADIEQQAQVVLAECLPQLDRGIGSSGEEDHLDIERLTTLFSFTTNLRNEGEGFEECSFALEMIKYTASRLRDQQKYEDARQIFQQLYLNRREALPAGMADYLVSCVDFANSLRLEGAYLKDRDILGSARTLLEETRPRMEEFFGVNDSHTLTCVICLASVHEYLENLQEAETHLSHALVMYKNVEASPLEKVSCQQRLAHNRFLQKKYNVSECQQRVSLSFLSRLTSLDDVMTLKVIVEWARSLIELGHLDEAGNLLVYALEEKIRQHSVDRALQAAWAALDQIADCFEEQGHTEKALRIRLLREKYNTAVLLSLYRQAQITDEELSLPEYGMALPVKIVQAESVEATQSPSHSSPAEPDP